MHYDIVVTGGTVLDPQSGRHECRDVYVKDGLFAAPPCDGVLPTCDIEINAQDCFVAPGFVDDHLHAHRGNPLGGNPDCICLPNGVTTAIEPGSAGIHNIGTLVEGSIAYSETNLKALLHVCPGGIQMPPHEEVADPAVFEPTAMLEAFRRYPGKLCGIKIRATAGSLGSRGLEPLKRAVKIANHIEDAGFRCPVVMHFSALPDEVQVEQLIEVLRPGDVFAHVYQPTGKTIFDSQRRLLPCMELGRKKGILFDSACSTTWSSVENLQDAVSQGFVPDIIGTDIVGYTRYKEPVVSLPNQMSFFMNLGMTLDEVVRAVTVTPAKAYGILGEAGTIAVGRPADVAVFREIECHKTYTDRYGGACSGSRLILPMATLRAGKTVFAQAFLQNQSHYKQQRK